LESKSSVVEMIMGNEFRNPKLPTAEELESAIEAGIATNIHIPTELRPSDPLHSLPGGLIVLPPNKPCILVPDLHARPNFLYALLLTEFPDLGEPLLSALSNNRITLLFLGDIPHAEGEEAARRWINSYDRALITRDARALLSPEMDEEMGLSLASLLKVMELQCRFPNSVFCLKGNHDNMTNAADHGDFPFYKYADEGRMGAIWLSLRYNPYIMQKLRKYELSLAIAAADFNFCASHAEPAQAISRDSIIAYREHPRVVQALIWTANDEAEEGSVSKSLKAILGSDEKARHSVWFSGHRPISGHFALRAKGQLVQIHNPSLWQIVFVDAESSKADFFLILPDQPKPQKAASLILDPLAR